MKRHSISEVCLSEKATLCTCENVKPKEEKGSLRRALFKADAEGQNSFTLRDVMEGQTIC